VVHPPASDVRGASSNIQSADVEHQANAAPAGNVTATKDHASAPLESDLHRTACKDGPCREPAPKPVQPKPVIADAPRKATPSSAVNSGSAAAGAGARNGVSQPCPAGQVRNGAQCLPVGAQQCLPGQNRAGFSCQDCTTSTASAQNIIAELRSARQRKDEVCLQNPTGRECQEADAHYNLTLNEYRNFLGGVPSECRTALPDPIAI
jgi:hypothetical protein